MLPIVASEFGIVTEPEVRFGNDGKTWANIRCVAKDRVRDALGQWVDGKPVFIDVIVNMGAEHLVDSVSVGDSIIAIGTLATRESEKDGVKYTSLQFRADAVGVSTRWGTAKTPRTIETEAGLKIPAEVKTLEIPF